MRGECILFFTTASTPKTIYTSGTSHKTHCVNFVKHEDVIHFFTTCSYNNGLLAKTAIQTNSCSCLKHNLSDQNLLLHENIDCIYLHKRVLYAKWFIYKARMNATLEIDYPSLMGDIHRNRLLFPDFSELLL